jgi:enoyl-CoA hydratase/carnithine racemase
METLDTSPVTAERVALDVADKFASLVTLNRAEHGNTIDEQVLEELATALEAAEADETVCVVLIAGRGADFCTGVDPAAEDRLRRDPLRYPRFLRRAQQVFESFRDASKPVVGLVNGRATGLGLELALWCDFLYCSESAVFGSGAATGRSGGAGALTLLPRMGGLAFAREMIFTGRIISADEAYRRGIVNRVVGDDQLLEAGLELAADTGRKFATAIAYAKNVINTGWHHGLGVDAALSLELERAARYAVTADE